MCRMTAFSATDIPAAMRRLFFHQMLIASTADNQQDGVGMSDGDKIFKGKDSFLYSGPTWISKLDENAVWLGHNRAASKATDRNALAAHPFAFDLGDGRFMHAAHNGYISGVSSTEAHEPNVDSYAAFKILAEMLRGGNQLTPELVDAWTIQFGVGSQWAFMIHLDGKVYILRGQREMHVMSIGNGFITNTSHVVLASVKEWINIYWPNYKIGKITNIDSARLITLEAGKPEYTTQNLRKIEGDSSDGKYYTWSNDQGMKLVKI